MEKGQIIDECLNQFASHSDYEKIKSVMGYDYHFLNQAHENKIRSFFIDDALEVCLPTVTLPDQKSHTYEHVHNNDLLIIGLCLKDKIQLNYQGKKEVKQSEVLYFRPNECVTITFLNHHFLYFILDLNKMKAPLFCQSYLDDICKKGELTIKQAPYMMTSCLDEIKAIKDTQVNHLLDYTTLKGELLSYFNCLVRFKLTSALPLNESYCNVRQCILKRVSEAKKVMMSHLNEHLSVSEIAEELDVSPYQLQKSFKEIEGTTVYDFILNGKMNHAKTYLQETDTSILDVAHKLGYENPSKFSATFKRVTGYTPTEYRQKNPI